jgi:nucleoid-associated protein YgaU
VQKVITMDQRVRIIAASGVLLGGLLLALLFRHEPPQPGVSLPASGDHLVLRKHSEAGPATGYENTTYRPDRPGNAVAGSPAARTSQPTILTPQDGTAPPALARAYPGNPQGSSRWGVSMGQMLPEANHAPVRPPAHKVVDGDTLASLAQQYLGAAERADEIFEANRGVLADPRILPIGTELNIPPREEASPVEAAPPRPLAPAP